MLHFGNKLSIKSFNYFYKLQAKSNNNNNDNNNNNYNKAFQLI